MCNERINSITASNYSVTLELSYYGSKIRVKSNGSCLKQDKIKYNQGEIVNIYIVYENKNYDISSNPTQENLFIYQLIWSSLFDWYWEAYNADTHKYKFSGYDIGFDRKRSF